MANLLSDTFASVSGEVARYLWVNELAQSTADVQSGLEMLLQTAPDAVELRDLADTYDLWAEKNLQVKLEFSVFKHDPAFQRQPRFFLGT